MNHIAPPHEPLIREVPLSRLALAPENVRKTPADPVAEAEMKASIAAHGLLENLVVRIDGPADAGAWAVVAGGRRLAAMKALAEDGTIDPDHPVPCLVAADPDNAGELSLAENVVRIAMHPADQVIAFTKLADAGLSVAVIAARFGTTERLVEQRLRLGNVAPDLLDAYRAGEIDLEVLKAFSVTTDHARQMAAWEQVAGQGYRPSAWQVKRLLTEERIPGATAVARFVGVEAYEAGGGQVLRDLFSREDDSAVWFDDPALLNNLAMEKLRVFKDELATRWKWAISMVEVDWNTTARYGRIHPEPAKRTPEEQAEIEKLEARQGVLAELDDDDWTEELVREAETIETRLDEIEGGIEARAVYKREDFGIAGCIATIARDGTLQVIDGLVRPEDMPKETAAESGAAQTGADSAGGHTAEVGTGTDTGRIAGPAMSGAMNLPKDREAEARKEAGVGISAPRALPRHDRRHRRLARSSAVRRIRRPGGSGALPVDRLRLAGARLARRNPPVARRDPGAAARRGARRHRHRPAPRRRGPVCPGDRPVARMALDGAAGPAARRAHSAPAGQIRALPLPLGIRRPALGRGPAAIPGAGAGRARHGARAGRPAVRLGAPRTRGASSPHPLPRQRSVRPTAALLTGSLKAGGCVSPFDPALLAATYRLQVSGFGSNATRR